MKTAIVRLNQSPRRHAAKIWLRLALIIPGAVALLWFLTGYPCQAAAFPVASTFVLWLGGAVAIKSGLKRLTPGRFSTNCGVLTVLAVAAWTLLSFIGNSAAQNAPQPPTEQLPAPARPASAAVLPGKGLAEHDFFYAGEAKQEKLFIVRDGKIAWAYTHNGRGEISDAVLEPNGNILFAHQFGVTEVNADKQVVWNYDAPTNTEIHTAQPYGTNSVWFVQNGDPAKFVVINKTTGATENEFVLPVKNPKSTHGHFRHARITDAGTLLVAHMDLGKAAEYDLTGKELWSLDVPGIWSASPLKNGNVLVVSNHGFVREVNRQGETVWEWTAADSPDFKLSSLQLATRLPNGNTLINNWANQWNGKIDPASAPVQAIEVTPEKKIVWVLRSWLPPADLGPATTIQLLDRQRL